MTCHIGELFFSPQIISNVTLQSTISVEESLFAAQLSPPELPLHLQQVSLVGEGDHGVRHHLLQQLLPHVAKGFILHLKSLQLIGKVVLVPPPRPLTMVTSCAQTSRANVATKMASTGYTSRRAKSSRTCTAGETASIACTAFWARSSKTFSQVTRASCHTLISSRHSPLAKGWHIELTKS